MTLAKVRYETSDEVTKLLSERTGAAVHHNELLAAVRRVVKAREERKTFAADTLLKLRKIYV